MRVKGILSSALCAVVAVAASALSAAAAPDPFVLEARPVALKTDAKPVLYVPVIKQPVRLDGRLDEPPWRNAAVVARWLPGPGVATPAPAAELRVFTDGETLYAGLSLPDADPAAAGLKKPAKPLDDYGGSLFEFFIDPRSDGKEKFQFCANPLGLRYDSRNDDVKWNGAWQSAGHVGERGWSVEVAVPLRDLGCAPVVTNSGRQVTANFGFVAPDGALYSWTGRWGAPESDYGVLYFGTEQDYAPRLRSVVKISCLLDREVYDLRDDTGVALLQVLSRAAEVPLREFQARLRVLSEAKTTVSETVLALPSAATGLLLDMKPLPPGHYTLNAELLWKGQPVSVSVVPISKARRTLLPEGAEEGRIRLTVPAAPDGVGLAWPISTGVPFAQGVLRSEENVRLLGPDGREVPCQTDVRARWNPKGSIAWLGLDFAPPLTAEPQVYVVEFGPRIQRSPAPAIRCDETDREIIVTTDVLRFTVRRDAFNLIDSLYADADRNGVFDPAEQLLAAGPGAGPYLVDHEGNRYEAALDRDARVVVEEKGPRKVVLLATGWYVRRGSEGKRLSCELPTDRLCQFRIRLTAIAGSPVLRCAVSTILTYDSAKVRLRDLAVTLPIKEPQGVLVGRDGTTPLSWPADAPGDGRYVLAHRWDSALDDAGDRQPGLSGWVAAQCRAGVAAVAMRNFRQLFPKEISLRDGALVWHLWPEHGREHFTLAEQLARENIYKLWFAHQGRDLDFRLPKPYYDSLDEEYQRTKAAGRAAFHPYYQNMAAANAQGLCIHADLALAFAPPPASAAQTGARLGALADADPHAAPDPAHVCATGVFGPILHADPSLFGANELRLDEGLRLQTRWAEANCEYGQFIWGGMHDDWDGGVPRRARIHRVWGNGHFSVARIPWMQYARTGEPAHLRQARDASAFLRDIAMVHYASPERSFPHHRVGAMYHCYGFAPWAGDTTLAGHPLSTDWLAYDYFMTGNRRSLDVMREWIDGIKDLSPGGNGTREGIQTLSMLIEAYRLTWDPALLELMRRFADTIFARPLADQGWWDYEPLLLARWHGLTGSEIALAAYRQAAVVAGKLDYGGGNRHLDACFALADGKPDALLPWRERLYREGLVPANTHPIYTAYAAHKLPCLLGAMRRFGLAPARPAVTSPVVLPSAAKTALVAVREDADRAIPVALRFESWKSPVQVRVWRDDGVRVFDRAAPPAKETKEITFAIPADGLAADYLIAVRFSDVYAQDCILWPLTDCAREVALLPANTPAVIGGWTMGASWAAGARYFFDSTGGLAQVSVPPEAGAELLDAKGVLVRRSPGPRLPDAPAAAPDALDIPADAPQPMSLYLAAPGKITFARTGASPSAKVVLALRPDALFAPKLTAEPPEAPPMR